jgi:hypothetical protein
MPYLSIFTVAWILVTSGFVPNNAFFGPWWFLLRVWISFRRIFSQSSRRIHYKYAPSRPPPCHPARATNPHLVRRLLQKLHQNCYNLQGIVFLWRHKAKLYQTTLLKPLLWSWIYGGILLAFLTPVLLVPLLLLVWYRMEWVALGAMEFLLVSPMFFLRGLTDQLFDQVLCMRGHKHLVVLQAVNLSRDKKSYSSGLVVGILHWTLSWATQALLHHNTLLSTLAWLFINGRFYAWGYHWHYLSRIRQKRKLSTQYRFIQQNCYAYHWFGMVALWLDRRPVLSVLMVLANTVGAALWASDVEDQQLEQPPENLLPSRPKSTTLYRRDREVVVPPEADPLVIATAIPIQLHEPPTAPHYCHRVASECRLD